MSIVKATNKIALILCVVLVYWVFVFVSIKVFGLKVFKENLSELFGLSIVGILAILFGAIILNIMFNLTAIAQSRESEGDAALNLPVSRKSWLGIIGAFICSLLVIFAFLYMGDRATSKKKEDYLVSAVSDLVSEQSDVIEQLSDYEFSRRYLIRASEDLSLLTRVEEKFPSITVIAQDKIKNKTYLLGFTRNLYLEEDVKPSKVRFILSTSSEERNYLNAVFEGKTKDYKFSSHDGRYEIYYPIATEKGTIVLHLAQYSRYGKIGS